MEPRIKDRFTDDILKAAMQRYGIAEGQIELLDGFESFMYEFTQNGQPGILRLGHSFRRTPQLVQAEVDWINYLAEGGAGVARALLSAGENLVEAIDDGQGEQFLATAFARAPGKHLRKAEVTEPLLERYGELVGRLHALSRHYTPPHADCVRFAWNSPVNGEVEKFLPPGDDVIAAHLQELMHYLNALPTPPDAYGLIHQDAHPGNFFVDEQGRFTLFDFDDCCYGHYIYDLAMVVFYTVGNFQDPLPEVQALLPSFLRGYRRQYHLDPAWWKEIPYFLKLREIDLYAAIHRSFGPGPYDDNPWVCRFMTGRRERLLAGLPFVAYDFAAVGEMG